MVARVQSMSVHLWAPGMFCSGLCLLQSSLPFLAISSRAKSLGEPFAQHIAGSSSSNLKLVAISWRDWGTAIKPTRSLQSELVTRRIDMQNAIPAHIADSARNLFRECIRRADYVGVKQGNRETLRALVRLQFRQNMHETDPIKIQEQKDAAVRGLFNHMFHEAEKMADPLNRWTGLMD